jgi:hypothetical protein
MGAIGVGFSRVDASESLGIEFGLESKAGSPMDCRLGRIQKGSII